VTRPIHLALLGHCLDHAIVECVKELLSESSMDQHETGLQWESMRSVTALQALHRTAVLYHI
jgi:hypothetical protein